MFTFDLNWQFLQALNPYLLYINFGLLVTAVLVGYAAIKRPIYAVAATIILLPTYLLRLQIGWLPTTFLECSILVTTAGWLVHHAWTKDSIRLPSRPVLLAIGLIVLAATIGVAISPQLREAAGLWKAYVIEPILVFFMLYDLIRTDKDRQIILWALGLGTLTISLIAICQWITGFGIAEASWMRPDRRRVTSLFTSPNAVGLFLGPIVALCFGWLMSDRKNVAPTVSKIVLIFFALIAIAFTKSIGTLLGLTAAGIVFAFFGWSKKWTSIFATLAIVACLLIPISRHALLDEILFRSPSGQNRLVLWEGAKNFLLSSPKHFIFGAGIFGFPEIQNNFRDPLKLEPLLYPHNIALNFWIEYGLLGLFGFSWLLYLACKNIFVAFADDKDGRWLKLGMLAALTSILVHGVIDVPYFKNDLAVLFWIIIALACVEISNLKSKISNPYLKS